MLNALDTMVVETMCKIKVSNDKSILILFHWKQEQCFYAVPRLELLKDKSWSLALTLNMLDRGGFWSIHTSLNKFVGIISRKNVTSRFLRNPWKQVKPTQYEKNLSGLKTWARSLSCDWALYSEKNSLCSLRTKLMLRFSGEKKIYLLHEMFQVNWIVWRCKNVKFDTVHLKVILCCFMLFRLHILLLFQPR